MKFVEASEILDVRTGKYDANHAVEKGKHNFYTCALIPLKADTYSFDDEVLILPGNGANVGEVLHYKGKLEAYQRTYVLHNIKAHPRYLYFYFKKFWIRQITKYQVGSATNYIKMKDITSFKIPLPPLSTQKKIAAILDAADAYRQKTKALIDKYDELAQSLFLDMFGDPVTNPKGWEVKKCEEVTNKISVGVVVKPASHYSKEGVIALRSLNIKANRIDLENIVRFNESDHFQKLSKSILKEGDVVVVRTGLTGTAAVIPKELSGSNCIDLIIVRVNKELLVPEYISCLLNSDRGKHMVNGKEVGGIQKHFNVGAIKSMVVPIPPLKIQQEFRNRLKSISDQKFQVQLCWSSSEDLFNSMLQRAFKGELV